MPLFRVTNSLIIVLSPITSFVFSPSNFLSCGIAPMLLLLTMWQSFPISVNSEIVLKFPIFTLSPIITLSSITLKAPIETLLPILAVLEITLVLCILLLLYGLHYSLAQQYTLNLFCNLKTPGSVTNTFQKTKWHYFYLISKPTERI